MNPTSLKEEEMYYLFEDLSLKFIAAISYFQKESIESLTESITESIIQGKKKIKLIPDKKLNEIENAVRVLGFVSGYYTKIKSVETPDGPSNLKVIDTESLSENSWKGLLRVLKQGEKEIIELLPTKMRKNGVYKTTYSGKDWKEYFPSEYLN
ncbi:MAG: hypothetical protein KKG60_02040 [Nanoarchaeota archaeon]|nr:hypothetical protein [Nanoarchaeota archaeon]